MVVALAPTHLRLGQNFRFGGVSRWGGRCRRWRMGHGQIKIQHATARHNDGPFDHVPEFPDIAGPVVALQFHDTGAGQSWLGTTQFFHGQFHEMAGQQRDVIQPFLQWQDLNGKDIEPVVEVFTEPAGRDVFFQVAIGRGNDPHIRAARAVLADAFVTFLLQDAEQFALQVQGDFADFIEEQGAARSRLETTGAVIDGTGKGTARVAEKLAFKQVLGNGSAVDPDEWFVLAPAAVVDFPGDQFLAGAGFTPDEHGGIGGGDEVNLADGLPLPAGWVDALEVDPGWLPSRADLEAAAGPEHKHVMLVEIHTLGDWMMRLKLETILPATIQENRQLWNHLLDLPAVPFRLLAGGIGAINPANIVRVTVWPPLDGIAEAALAADLLQCMRS